MFEFGESAVVHGTAFEIGAASVGWENGWVVVLYASAIGAVAGV